MRVLHRIVSLALLVFALCGAPAVQAQSNFWLPAPTQGASNNAFIRLIPTYIDAGFLAASTTDTHTIPSGAKWVLFSGTCNFFAKIGASASIPAAAVTDGTAPELNPAAWYLPAGPTQITLISSTAGCIVTLTYYK